MERGSELRMTGQLVEQQGEIVQPHRHRPAANPAVCRRRVCEPHEPLAVVGLEELDVRRERPWPGCALGDDDLVNELGLAPRSRLLRHATTVAANPSHVRARCVTKHAQRENALSARESA
jgi:hypothetical protein